MFSERFIDSLFSEIKKMKVMDHEPHESPFSTVHIEYENKSLVFKFSDILKKMYMRAYFSILTDTGKNVEPITIPNNYMSIKVQKTGENHPIHSDAGPETFGYGDGEELYMSSIIPLNDSYNGGVVRFPEDDVSIKLKKGSMMLFPSHGHVHEVTEVTSGTRYTLLQFWQKS